MTALVTTPPSPVLYRMFRHQDTSGVSGDGLVAYLTAYPGGKVTLAWCASDVSSIGVYDSIEDVLQIHGHDGATELIRMTPESTW